MAEEMSPLENHGWWMEQLRKDAKANRPEALQLADELTEISKDPWAKYWERCLKAAAELRRLHTVEQQRDELLAALKMAWPQLIGHAERTARAAIDRVEKT
jgi:hypothetical protein